PAPRPAHAEHGGFAQPLSPDQERMWLFDQMLPASPGYDAPTVVRVRGPLSIAAMDVALDRLVTRHDSFRTRFPRTGDGVPVQVVDAALAARPRWRYLDLAGLPDQRRLTVAADVVRQAAARPFDLDRGPLWYAAVIRLGVDDHVLLLGMHHLVADLWSLNIVIDELSAAYRAASHGGALPAPVPPAQPAGLALRQRDRLTPARLDRLRRWWADHLTGVRPVALPTDRPRPPLPNLTTYCHEGQLPPDLADALRRIGHQHRVTLYATLLAALNTLVAGWSGQGDLLTVSVTAGRHGRAAEGTVGLLTGCLVVRVDTTKAATFAALLPVVQEAVVDALDHAALPFADLVAHVDPGRDLEPSPLRQLGFSLHNTPSASAEFPGATIGALPPRQDAWPRGVSEADLWWEVFDHGTGPLAYRLQADDRLFRPDGPRRVMSALRQLLHTVGRHPETPLSRLAPVALPRPAPAGSGQVPPMPAAATDHPLVEPAPAHLRHAVALLVTEVLGIAPTSDEDNFFRLGGTSMDAVRLAARLAADLGAEVSLYELMTTRTVAGMAAAVHRAQRDSVTRSSRTSWS
ncbi:condensation domain-containing protein, partial [Micromonospora craterilacus]